MKRIVIAIVALFISISTTWAQRLSDISVEAQYITEKMTIELGLNNSQRNSILQLNLNYLNGINSYRDIDSKIWKQRNKSLKMLLNSKQWQAYKNARYFYHPIGWENGAYVHYIYSKYPRKFGKPDHHKPHKPMGKPGKHHKPRHDKRHHETFGSRR